MLRIIATWGGDMTSARREAEKAFKKTEVNMESDIGLEDMAKEIKEKLKLKFSTTYDDKDAIGRRYRRQDAIGTPYCITVDHQTLDDNTITVRDRDSMKQERIKIETLEHFLNNSLDINNWLLKGG